MRYLCTNPGCSAFARLVAGTEQTCPACGQRVLDERVMLKHGRSVQSIAATKGRAVSAPAPVPRPVTAGADPPTWGEETRRVRKRDEELRQLLPPEKLAALLQEHTIAQIAREYQRPEGTIKSLLRQYNMTVRGIRNAPPHEDMSAAQPSEEGAQVADMMPDTPVLPAPPASTKPEPSPAAARPAPRSEPPAPAPAPSPSGFQVQINRAGRPSDVISRDLGALLGAIANHNADARFNLTVILEEAS